MKKYVKKVYLSIMLIVFSLLTMVATTYAWVGLLTSSTFDEFTINLQENDSPDAAEYGIEVSLDGKKFSDSINQRELQRYLLHNIDPDGAYKDYLKKRTNGEYVVNDNKVTDDFRKLRITQCTTERYREINGQLSPRLSYFKDMNNNITSNLFQFDLYISIYKINSTDDYQSDKKLDLYLNSDKLITASTVTNPSGLYSTRLFNDISYPTMAGSYLGQPILNNPNVQNSIGTSRRISGDVKIDIANSCRVAFEKYNSMPKGDNSSLSYDDEMYIYQTGSIYPTYDANTGIYDFGGVLPNDYNFARLYYNSIYVGNELGNVPEGVLDRGDVVYDPTNEDVVHIVNQDDNVTTSRMVCFRVYFWFEGWDSDCFEIIDNKSVTVNLSFTTKSPNEGN